MNKNSRLVYSTETGRVKEDTTRPLTTEQDGIIRIRRESKGRGGKIVCVIEGLPLKQIKSISKSLKSACATGGAIKNGCIEIQGDHREKIKSKLEAMNFQVKFSGG